ncbi:MAG: hypothetical protein K8R39_11130 [Arcobacteraceae bacterium]|nr:hypothetical protein [Arcobacteraceae bacterium]
MRLKVIILTLFIFSYGIVLLVTSQNKNTRLDLILKTHINLLKTHYKITKDYFITDAKNIQSTFLEDKYVINILEKAQRATNEERAILRKELYDFLAPLYKRLQLKGINQIHIVFSNNISFLRMHKPNKFGDDLTEIRYTFKYANEMKKSIFGFEQGRSTHAFRYTFPFIHNNQHMGAIDISLSSESIQEKLQDINNIHSHFLVDKKIFHKKVWESSNLMNRYIQSIEHKDYMFTLNKFHNKERLLNSKKRIIFPLKDEINKKIELKQPFAVYKQYTNNVNVVTFLPIDNVREEKAVAYLVSYDKDPYIYDIYRSYSIINIVLFVGLATLFYFIYRNLNYKKELEEEVSIKTKDLQKVSKNLKDLNENLEQKIVFEVEKSKAMESKLFQSEKMASMGEMIGNIAHQWRQPLSVISTGVTGMKMQKEYDLLTDDIFNDTCDVINKNAQYLSTTIDDFRNYIKGDREKKVFNLKKDINSFIHLVEGSIHKYNINIVLDLDESIEINGYENELTQCFINIFNNAKDVLVEIENSSERYLFISTSIENDRVLIKIKDNGGGIQEDIMPKIFEPYFTTKHQSQGTGLGLHMTYSLIVEGMNGTIEAKNICFDYEDKNYNGLEITITLPSE